MQQDIKIIRGLARQYAEIASDERNKDTIELHKAVSDLHPIRPTVLIDEVPWHEMNFDDRLTLRCQDPYLRMIEDGLRKTIYQWENFPADMAVLPYLGVRKVVQSEGIGVEVKEETQVTDNRNHIVSHRYENQFNTPEDLNKLHFDKISYNEVKTKQQLELLSNAVGDIIPVKIIGVDTGYMLGCITWDIIATFMGVSDLLYNLMDEPEFMHSMVARFTDIFLDQIHQYEKLNLFNAEAATVHCSAAWSDDLKNIPCDPNNVTAKNMWGRGLAQILQSVSPEMHDEFDIKYMCRAMEPFGLVYYGCCEALDKKIDILKQIKNLRKISISPWSDVEIAAEAIEKSYVMSAKPNPSAVATNSLDVNATTAELKRIIDAATKNDCPTELLLKDISTVGFNPKNLFEWEKLAMSMVR